MAKLTFDEFCAYLRVRGLAVLLTPEARVEPCHCGDMNCRGWRIVAKGK